MPCPYHHTYTNSKATARPEEHMKSYRLVSVYINKNLFGFAWIKVTFQNWTITSPRTFILLHGRNVLLFVSLARRSVSTLEVSTGNETNLETNCNFNFEIFVLGQQQLAELGSSYANKLINHIKNQMHNKEQNFERDQYVLNVNVIKSVFSILAEIASFYIACTHRQKILPTSKSTTTKPHMSFSMFTQEPMLLIHTKPDNWESVRSSSLFPQDVTKNSNEGIINSSEFLLSWGSTAPKHLYLYKFSVCERILRFAKEDAWISRLLSNETLSWRPGKLFRGLKTLLIFEILLSKHSLW